MRLPSLLAFLLVLSGGRPLLAQFGSTAGPGFDPLDWVGRTDRLAFGGGSEAPFAPSLGGAQPPTRLHGLLGRLLSPLSTEPDPDGLINTDRPTFTPSNELVPLGRLQFESGYTFTHNLSSTERTDIHLYPGLAVRYGLLERVELRSFWGGISHEQITIRTPDQTSILLEGSTDLTLGFKWHLFNQRGWVPRSALITDVAIPVDRDSPASSENLEPIFYLLYGWELTDRLAVAGSTGLTSIFDRGVTPNVPDASYEQFSQSCVAFFSASERITLFGEWFVLVRIDPRDEFSNGPPENIFDGGLLFHATPNLQFDLRAGFGLDDSPNDFLAGAGVSFRY